MMKMFGENEYDIFEELDRTRILWLKIFRFLHDNNDELVKYLGLKNDGFIVYDLASSIDTEEWVLNILFTNKYELFNEDFYKLNIYKTNNPLIKSFEEFHDIIKQKEKVDKQNLKDTLEISRKIGW